MNGILQSFGDWLSSLGTIPRGCIKVVTGIDSLLFIAKWHSMVWLQRRLFNHHLFKGISVVSSWLLWANSYEHLHTGFCVALAFQFSGTKAQVCNSQVFYGSSSFDQTTIRKKPQAACQHVYTILCSHQQSINILTIHSLGVVTNFVSHVHKCVIIHLSLQFFPSFSEVWLPNKVCLFKVYNMMFIYISISIYTYRYTFWNNIPNQAN